jgi:hypothetical protein
MICPYLCLAPDSPWDSPSSPDRDDEAMEATMAMLLAAISCV